MSTQLTKCSSIVAGPKRRNELLSKTVAPVTHTHKALAAMKRGGKHRAGPVLFRTTRAHKVTAIAAVMALSEDTKGMPAYDALLRALWPVAFPSRRRRGFTQTDRLFS